MPIVWFYDDDHGDLIYLNFRLGIKDMMLGETMSSLCQDCTSKYVQDLSTILIGDEVDPSCIPSSPIPFTELKIKLYAMGAITFP